MNDITCYSECKHKNLGNFCILDDIFIDESKRCQNFEKNINENIDE